MGGILFDIAPIGIMFLLLLDLYHLIECLVIKPIFYVMTCGLQIRTISYGELGYYKLRRVSEIFSEAIPQAFIQLYILISVGEQCEKCTPLSVLTALTSSCFVLTLWCTIIYVEGKKNGLKFVEYVTVIFQGSFNFVEMLPAIERGTENGIKVNWCMYKFTEDGVGHAAKGVNSPHCRLKLLKISNYTIKDLDRHGAAFLGGALNQCEHFEELIISRLESEIMSLFDEYDVDHGKSLDFDEFVHLCLDIKEKTREPCLRSDVFLIYEELADSVRHEVWQLDLQIKIKASLEYVGLLDFAQPLQHAYEESNLKMMSLLMAYEYDTRSEDNEAEFEWCVADAITKGRVREALCLCEHKGVPIVVHMAKGEGLMACDDDGQSDPYVRVSIFDQVKTTTYRKQTLNPVWGENQLFIIPFDFMDKLFDNNKMRMGKLDALDLAKDTSGPVGQGGHGLAHGQGMGYAAVDLAHAAVTMLGGLPEYTRTAIVHNLEAVHQKRFEVQHAEDEEDMEDIVAQGPPDLMKVASTEQLAFPKGGASKAGFGHSPTLRSGQTLMKIRFRVFDHDVDDEDDFMGSLKIKVNLAADTAGYHKHMQVEKLHNNQESDPNFDAGKISYRVYLNAVQVYQDTNGHVGDYIDDLDVKDEPIKLFEITDTSPQMQNVYRSEQL